MMSGREWSQSAPGRHHDAVTAVRLPDGSVLRVAATTLVGVQPGPRVVVTAGVHGDEFEGVRAVAELCRTLDPARLRGTLVLVPVANPPAFNAGTRASPLDGVNLNRVFPGDVEGTPSERLAHALFREVVAGADALLDLHSGGTRYLFHPQAGFYRGGDAASIGERSFALARAFGIPLLWDIPHRAGVFSYEAARAGVPAIGVEIGGNGRCEPSHVALALRGVRNALAHLDMLDPTTPSKPAAQRVWAGDFTLCPASGLFEPAVTLNQRVDAGELLYRLIDLRGEVAYEHHAPHAGLVSALRVFAAIGEGEWDISVLRAVESER